MNGKEFFKTLVVAICGTIVGGCLGRQVTQGWLGASIGGVIGFVFGFIGYAPATFWQTAKSCWGKVEKPNLGRFCPQILAKTDKFELAKICGYLVGFATIALPIIILGSKEQGVGVFSMVCLVGVSICTFIGLLVSYISQDQNESNGWFFRSWDKTPWILKLDQILDLVNKHKLSLGKTFLWSTVIQTVFSIILLGLVIGSFLGYVLALVLWIVSVPFYLPDINQRLRTGFIAAAGAVTMVWCGSALIGLAVVAVGTIGCYACVQLENHFGWRQRLQQTARLVSKPA